MFKRKSPEDKLLDAYWLKYVGYEEDAKLLLVKIAQEVGTGNKKEADPSVSHFETEPESSPSSVEGGETVEDYEQGVHCE